MQYNVSIQIDDGEIRSCPHIKYLGVIFNHTLIFKEHTKHASAKTPTVQLSLARVMPIGPSEKLGNCFQASSTMMYGGHRSGQLQQSDIQAT